MAHACVVTVNDEQLVGWFVSETLSQRGLLGGFQAGGSEQRRRGKDYEFGCHDSCRLHT
jgi:hypothetical protein